MTSLNQNTGLPSDLDFTLKKGAPRGIRCFRTQLAPIGGISTSGATNGDTLKWDIPVGIKGQYINTMETYVQIRVRNGGALGTAAGNLTLDGSAYCFMNKLQILSSGAIVEDIGEYANFCNAQIDAGIGPTIRQTASNIMMGTGTDFTTPAVPLSAPNSANILRGGNILLSGTYQNYTLPLVSGILGAQGSTKYFPAHAVSTDLRCEITLQPIQQLAVISSATVPSSWSIIEANLMLSYIEVDTEVQNMIDGSTGGNYYISTETWRQYNNNIGANMLGDTVLIPAKFSSVKGMIHTFRPTAAANSFLMASQSHRINPFFSSTVNCSVQYSIGSAYYPSTPIRSAAELFVELQRYYHNLANPNITGVINAANYTVTADPAALSAAVAGGAVGSSAADITAYFNGTGTGIFGINLDQISNRSDVMASGISTQSSNIIANFTYATPYTGNMRLDTYVHIDQLLVIENGVLSIRT